MTTVVEELITVLTASEDVHIDIYGTGQLKDAVIMTCDLQAGHTFRFRGCEKMEREGNWYFVNGRCKVEIKGEFTLTEELK